VTEVRIGQSGKATRRNFIWVGESQSLLLLSGSVLEAAADAGVDHAGVWPNIRAVAPESWVVDDNEIDLQPPGRSAIWMQRSTTSSLSTGLRFEDIVGESLRNIRVWDRNGSGKRG
jgi:hypothetical protein